MDLSNYSILSLIYAPVYILNYYKNNNIIMNKWLNK